MDKICDYKDCTGCMACYNACTKNAIKMQPNEEGFLHPEINARRCIDCGVCSKVCPINKPPAMYKPLKIFSGWSNNEETRLISSSGGAFTEISKLILAQKGVVFGVAMDENIEARHIFIENEHDLYRLQGSKYVQSIIGNTYKEVKLFLQEGKTVLFSGTPCQIAGLYNFLRKDYENLYTVDLICHGVPSPKVFADYKDYISESIKEPVKDIKFRCKKSSWIFYNMGINSHVEKNKSTKYSYIGHYYADPYIRAFLRDNILRPNCYQCRYTSLQRISDFTIADWWGYKATTNDDKDFDRKGVSLIMCNTNKAVSLSSHLNMNLRNRNLEEALRTNQSLKKPFPMPITRSEFWKDYQAKTFGEMVTKWMYPERIPYSLYLKIYHRNQKLLQYMFSLCEKVLRKIGLGKLIIVKQAK